MRAVLTAALATMIASGTGHTEEFKLKSEKDGTTYGPFQCADGARVAIGDATFQVVKGKDDKPLEERALGGLIQDGAELSRVIADLNTRNRAISTAIEAKFQPALPTGKQSYGEFTWTCRYVGKYLRVTAKDDANKQHAWAHVYYYPEMPERRRQQFKKTCLDLSAMRFENKWVWVLVGRTEIRLSVTDKALESDATLDAIVKSFNLEKIGKL